MIIREKVPAKVNLTLDVVGTEGNYHNINSLVASITLFDAITLVKRKDKRVCLTNKGLFVDCPAHDNNAVKAASLFIKKFGTKGVNIIINKKIPVGGGLGGSSADIAGVLKGMKKLYGIDCDLKPLADELGSDATYMLDGGYAGISGRGTEVKKLKITQSLPLILISSKAQISAKNCYKKYDEMNITYPECTDSAVKLISSGDLLGLAKVIKNDLQPAAEQFIDVRLPKLALEEVGAKAVLVSGSGPTVYGVFINNSARDLAYKKLFPLFGDRAIKANTISHIEPKN